jgi:UDP-N-acetylmuramoyl-tripeptide--D-alanyl-D-alanine ligase
MLINELHTKFLECDSVSTDTRTIKHNSIFFALSGPNFNGNRFADEAIVKGAAIVVVDDVDYFIDDDKHILVEDVLVCLQKLSNYHRKHLKAKVVALTGSNGKTTTKELINAVLSSKFSAACTKGNLNNHIGVPLTLLECDPSIEFLIVEMGANHQGEIANLCLIAEPDYGLITNIGKAHLEGFGGLEGVKKGKGEMFQYLLEHDKVAFVNSDVKVVNEVLPVELKTITYNRDLLTNINLEDKLQFSYENLDIQSNLLGSYNLQNIIQAIGIGRYFGVHPDLIKKAIEAYQPDNNRSQEYFIDNTSIFMDAYNANPTSMEVSIKAFLNRVEHDQALLIIGDMLELGEVTALEHKGILELIFKSSNIPVVAIGPIFYQFKDEFEKYQYFNDVDSYCNKLNFNEIKGKSIFLKGSRGIKLERLIKHLESL